MFELLGYLATILLALSLLVNNDLKFRWLNSAGNLSFIIYGILIQAFPVILTNCLLQLINIYYLVKIYRTREDFDLVEFKDEDQLVQKFRHFYRDDMEAYFPGYQPNVGIDTIRFLVLRDIVIANIFAATLQNNGIAWVRINYTVPRYRDFKVGRFIFEKERKYLVSRGVQKIVYQKVNSQQHLGFLKKMKFKKENINGIECLSLSLT